MARMPGLKKKRLEAGVSQEQLGRQIGRTGAYISQLESDKCGYSPEVLASLTRELKCTADDLLNQEGHSNA